MLLVSAPQLSIVIPTWNQVHFTRTCVESLRRNTDVDYELIIVDNGSEASAAAEAQQLADKFIGNDTTLGVARGMNQGLAIASGRAVVFANNDTEFPASWASLLLETLRSGARPGIVLPAVTAAGNQASVRDAPADRRTVFPPFSAIPSGVIYMMQRDTIIELGGWNVSYGVASAEDLDLLFTVWANGLSVVLDERVLVRHESAASALKLPDRDALYARNRLAFAARWSNADPQQTPRLSTCDQKSFAANLERARIAATWMEKWFQAMDATAREARARRVIETKAATRRPVSPASRLSKRLVRKMKRVRARITK